MFFSDTDVIRNPLLFSRQKTTLQVQKEDTTRGMIPVRERGWAWGLEVTTRRIIPVKNIELGKGIPVRGRVGVGTRKGRGGLTDVLIEL